MSKSTHQIEVEKLGKIEADLLELIANTDNEELQNKFLEWQRQREICNNIFIEEWDAVVGRVSKEIKQ